LANIGVDPDDAPSWRERALQRKAVKSDCSVEMQAS
jgi:hypothetical protein